MDSRSKSRPWHHHFDYNVPTTIRYPRFPIQDLLQIPANTYPEKSALIFYECEISFWQLRRQVMRMANAMSAIGVKNMYTVEELKAPAEDTGISTLVSFDSVISNIEALCQQVEIPKERLAAYKVPKIVEFRDSLPKSAVGKVLRKILRQEEEERRDKGLR